MRNANNAVAYTGSNTVIARQALEEIGGFPTDTITEDFRNRHQDSGEGLYDVFHHETARKRTCANVHQEHGDPARSLGARRDSVRSKLQRAVQQKL